ncbi:FAD binding domain-containing protein [Truncatella angustata]|uniref:FAD binding domain-containing protein n=1 Tax=Truncatella angustata TaxID=152316 RepID=A0A9P8RLS8_9PEZI|nr:FAD binding domain-containing protein [Truncatella angustata]KAH6645461.1 FAD binding domain-containing protein [Truncatella angustata]
MLSHTILGVLATALTAAAAPALHTSSGDALVRFLEKRATTLNITISPGASIVYPDQPEWTNDTARWSTWSPPTYSVAFLPATEQDITTALQYMTRNNISFLAQGGGHGNTLTFSTVQDAVVINLENFGDVTVNDDETISVGGGAVFANVYAAAYAAGRELPAGSCPCVGAGGASIGGGHGRLQGEYGMIVDVIVKLRVALWDGSIIDVSATEHADLFWAMRGAGHNFGIVLEYTFKTFPQQNDGQNYNGDMTFTTDSLEGVLSVVNDLIPDQDPGLAIDIFITYNETTQTPGLLLNVVYHGTLEQGQAYTARFATSQELGIERTWLNESTVAWENVPSAAARGAITHACTEGLSYDVYTVNTKSFDIAQQRELFESYVEFVEANPLAVHSIFLYEIFSQRAVLAQNPASTAFGNRQYGNILMLLQGTYTDDSVASAWQEWADHWRSHLWAPEHSGYPVKSVYMNYARGDEPLQALYGYEPWREHRLRKLKAKYDPHGFFNHYNSVLGHWNSPN